MPNHFDVFEAPTNVGARLPRFWTDLTGLRFRVQRDDANKTVRFTCTLRNNGDIPATGPFFIIFGVSYSILHENDPITIPRSFTIEQQIIFTDMMEIAGGATFTTPPITAELGYRNVSPSNRYTLSVLVDPEMQLQELSTANNRLELDWYAFQLSAFAKATEARGNDGPGIVVDERVVKHT